MTSSVGNCQDSFSVQVYDIDVAIAIDSANSYLYSCNDLDNGQLALTTNNNNVNYTWSDGQTTQTATGLATGYYSVTASELGCTDTTGAFVDIKLLEIAIDSARSTFYSCNGSAIPAVYLLLLPMSCRLLGLDKQQWL